MRAIPSPAWSRGERMTLPCPGSNIVAWSIRMLRTVVAVGLLLVAGTAHAGLIGDRMSVGYYYPNKSTGYDHAIAVPDTFIIGGGAETSVLIQDETVITADFGADTLKVTFNTRLSDPR